ncbi:MAG: IS66 family transposase [Verrucomicrobia bacterium]|nr:IS66 family transposase [Verrucomicrobiota bacterium]
MKVAAALLRQWHSDNPARLLQAALWQAERLAEMAPELDALRAQNVSLHQQLEVQTERIAQLEEALQAAQRAAHRQAAPFRIEEKKRVLAPKRPGRKRGHPGLFRHKPEYIDEQIEVQLCCPHCGGMQFKDHHAIEQRVEDLPSLRPYVTRLTTYQGTCVGCGQSVRSSHPLQMSLATGAAGVQLGPHALALAADLNKAKGLSMRKTCAVLRDCFGLQLSPGGLSQALDRLALKVKPQYDALAAELRQAPALHSDETSWWVAGPGWWLWVFTTQLLTFYVVVQSRGRELLQQILGKDFRGVLVSDCLAIYDGATALQQKCYAHHHKAIRQAKALHPDQGEGFLCEVEAMLRAALALQQQKADLSPESFSDLRQTLEHKALQLLEPPRNEPNEQAVRNRLNKQRDHLFTFLDHDGVDATNNLAERQLRPAVIARKISCGNKTKKGAQTWQILTSLASTCTQRATSFIAEITRAAPLQAR